MQNPDNQPQAFNVETPNQEQQYQQQQTQDSQQPYQGQQYPPSYTPPPPQPMYGAPQYAQGQPFPQGALQTEVVVVKGPQADFATQQMLCNQSRFPTMITCPYCQKQGTTRIDYKMGGGSWLCVFILWLFLCCVCCIPCFNDKCQDANHFCPNCGQQVGSCQYKACS